MKQPISICVLGLTNSTRPVVQSVMCLTTDACLTADTGVASLIQSWGHKNLFLACLIQI